MLRVANVLGKYAVQCVGVSNRLHRDLFIASSTVTSRQKLCLCRLVVVECHLEDGRVVLRSRPGNFLECFVVVRTLAKITEDWAMPHLADQRYTFRDPDLKKRPSRVGIFRVSASIIFRNSRGERWLNGNSNSATFATEFSDNSRVSISGSKSVLKALFRQRDARVRAQIFGGLASIRDSLLSAALD